MLMKSLFILVALLSTPLLCFSQTKDRKAEVGFHLGIYIKHASEDDHLSVTGGYGLSACFGYFITKKIETGAFLGYSFGNSTSEFEDEPGDNRSSINYGIIILKPFFRLFIETSHPAKLFFQINGFYQTNFNRIRGSDGHKYYNTVAGYGIGPGIEYPFNNKWSVTGNLVALEYKRTFKETVSMSKSVLSGATVGIQKNF